MDRIRKQEAKDSTINNEDTAKENTTISYEKCNVKLKDVMSQRLLSQFGANKIPMVLIGFATINILLKKDSVPYSVKVYLQLINELKNKQSSRLLNSAECLIDDNMTVRTYLNQCKDILVSQLSTRKDIGSNLADQIIIALQFDDIKAIGITNSEIGIHVSVTDSAIEYIFYWNSFISQKIPIRFVIEAFSQIINQMILSIDKPISNFVIPPWNEETSNSAECQYRKPRNIIANIELSAINWPDKMALITRKEPISYKQMVQSISYLSKRLIQSGQSTKNVAIFGSKSAKFIIGMLSCLKARASYVPISSQYPEKRIVHILEEASVEVIICDSHFYDTLYTYDSIRDKYKILPILDMKDIDVMSLQEEVSHIVHSDNDYDSENNIYTLFTSGSTGVPKGVTVKRYAAECLYSWYIDEVGLSYETVCLIIAPLTFDLCQKNIFSVLMVGGTLVIEEQDVLDYETINNQISEYGVSLINCTPSTFYPLITYGSKKNYCQIKSLRSVILGGEKIEIDRLVEWQHQINNTCDVYNSYGPTECTDVVSYYKIDFKEDKNAHNIPIGKSLPSAKLFVCDNNLQPVDKGKEGELIIGGECVSSGYIGSHKNNNQQFTTNHALCDGIVYRTGDIVRVNSEGLLEFCRRDDNQVKLRGYRIELGEIEAEIRKVEGVLSAVVVINNEQLMAYIVSTNRVSEEQIALHLKEYLPTFMIPDSYSLVDEIPLTNHGKVDRRRLVKMSQKKEKYDRTEIVNQEAKKLFNLWQRVLGHSNFSYDDDFFSVGGHSLRIAILGLEIHQEFEAKVSVNELLNYRTINKQLALIRTEKSHKHIIEKAPKSKTYPMTAIQKRLFNVQETNPNSTAYNSVFGIILKNTINVNKLNKAINKVIRDNDILRTNFDNINGSYMQKILPHFEFQLTDITTDMKLQDVLHKFMQPFNLRKDQLLRVSRVQMKESAVLLFDMHHIITDGISQNLFINKVLRAYNGTLDERQELQFSDYAVWEQTKRNLDKDKRSITYWKNKLRKANIEIPLPRKANAKRIGTPSVNRLYINELLYSRIKSKCDELGITIFMFMLGVYSFSLKRYSGEARMTIGTPVFGRKHKDLMDMLGVFINTLILSVEVNEDQSVLDFLTYIKNECIDTFKHQEISIETLIEEAARNQDMNVGFSAMYIHQNMEYVVPKIDEQEVEVLQIDPLMVKNDITLETRDYEKGLELTLTYDSGLFSNRLIEDFMESMIQVTNTFILDNDSMINSVNILNSTQSKVIRQMSEGYKLTISTNDTIRSRVKKVFEAMEEKNAVFYQDTHYTYGDLYRLTSKVYKYLRDANIQKSSVIGIKIEKGVELYASILAILCADMVYLPLDPEYPDNRLNYMIQDSGAKIILSDEEPHDEKYVNIFELVAEEITVNDIEKVWNDTSEINASRLSYIIYTSGTTGQPKGVKIKERSVLNLVESLYRSLQFTNDLRILALTTISFDIFVIESLLPLLYGMEIIVPDRGRLIDNRHIINLIEEGLVDVVQSTPTRISSLLSFQKDTSYLAKLSYLLVGGEAFDGKIINMTMPYQDVRLFNMYGPTETTVWSSFKEIKDNEGITVGKPISNTSIFILDDNMNVCPQNVTGNLYIGGVGVAAGYHNLEELTAERFKLHSKISQDIIYKTGDLARWVDGEIDFVGRIDNQIKLRGYRIELLEVENTIKGINGISEAVVLKKTNHQNIEHLVCFYSSERSIQHTQVRNEVSRLLPFYMVPSYFISLDIMPLTPNGKVDRNSLTNRVLPYKLEKPSNVSSENDDIRSIWIDVLEHESFDDNTDFFSVGGHSLNVVKMITLFSDIFGVAVTIKELFDNRTLNSQRQLIRTKEPIIKSKPIPKAPEMNYYPMSSAQKRIFFIQQLRPDSTIFNLLYGFKVFGELSILQFEKAVNNVIDKYEILRTSFHIRKSGPVQQIHSHRGISAEVIDIDETITGKVIHRYTRPFDLEADPLLRAYIIKNHDSTYVFFEIHHLIFDGPSQEVLFNEIRECYCQKGCTIPKLQYKDYVFWAESERNNEKIKSAKEFWLNKLRELPLKLVLNGPLINSKSEYIRKIDYVDKQLVEETLVHVKGTPYALFLGLYAIALNRFSGRDKFVIGTPYSGRVHNDLIDTMGLFTNLLSLLLSVDDEKCFDTYISWLTSKIVEAMENGHYQFDWLVEDLKLGRELDESPIFNVIFVYHEYQNVTSFNDKLTFEPIIIDPKENQYDITFIVNETENSYELILESRTELNSDEVMVSLLKAIQVGLEAVRGNIAIKIGEMFLADSSLPQKKTQDDKLFIEETKFSNLIEWFKSTIHEYPNKTCFIYNETLVSYSEFYNRVQHISALLLGNGIKKGERICVYTNNPIEAISAFFGILMSGGVYVPLDSTNNLETNNMIIEEVKARYIITGNNLKEHLLDGEAITIDSDERIVFANSSTPILNQTDSAYIIYTSGSTGQPKGVEISHSNIINAISWRVKEYNLKEEERSLQLFTHIFDGYFTSILTPFFSGIASVLVPREKLVDIRIIIELIKRYDVTGFIVIPTLLVELLKYSQPDDFKKIKAITLAGEMIPKSLIHDIKIIYPQIQLHNEYGPTENTIVSTHNAFLTENEPNNIGKPIRNVSLVILDEKQRITLPYVIGEMYIYGSSLAKGYINRPIDTDSRFIRVETLGDIYAYRSGDYGYRNNNNEIIIIGRKDRQCKVNGYRLELDAIESVITSLTAVNNCFVQVEKNYSDSNVLVAYYLSDSITNQEEIIVELKDKLPQYAIPKIYRRIKKVCYNNSNKVDIKKTISTENLIVNKASQTNNATDDGIKMEVKAIWEEILGVKCNNYNLSFFEYGGNSISLMTLYSELESIYPDAVSLADLFSASTINKITIMIKNKYPCECQKRVNRSITISLPPSIDRRENRPSLLTLILTAVAFMVSETDVSHEIMMGNMAEFNKNASIRIDMEEYSSVDELFLKIEEGQHLITTSGVGVYAKKDKGFNCSLKLKLEEIENSIVVELPSEQSYTNDYIQEFFTKFNHIVEELFDYLGD